MTPDNIKEIVHGCCGDMFRVKAPRYLPEDASLSTIHRRHTISDLFNTGLYSVMAVGIFSLSGIVVKDFAGPSVILSVFVAALAIVFTGICYGELRCRWLRVNAHPYEYVYLTVGEAPAFLVGWLLICQKLTAVSAVARATSSNFDALLNYKIFNMTRVHIGKIASEPCSTYPDLVAPFILILVCTVITVGFRPHKLVRLISNGAILLLMLFTTIVGLFHIDFSLWSNTSVFFQNGAAGVFEGAALLFTGLSAFEVICNSSDATVPTARRNTVISMIASTGVQMFVLLVVCGGVTLITPVTSIKTEAVLPEAFDKAGVHWIKYISVLGALPILATVLWNVLLDVTSVIVAMATDGVLFSCLANVSDKTDTPIVASVVPGFLSALLSIIFSQHNLLVLSSLSCLAVMIICCLTALCLRYRPISMLRSPEHSGKARHKANRARKKQQKKSNSIQNNDHLVSASGIYGSTNASGSNGETFVQSPCATSAATLISPTDTAPFHGQLIIEDTDEHSPVVQNGASSFTYVTAGDSEEEESDSSDMDIDEAVEEYRERLRDSALQACGIPESPSNPTELTSKRATIAALSFLVWAVLLSVIICHASEKIVNGNVIVILLMVVFVILSLMSLVFLLVQPQQSSIAVCDMPIQMIQVPVVPIFAVTLNVHLMLRLSGIAWIQIMVWLFIGTLIYFAYGIRNSFSSNVLYQLVPEEERILMPSSPTYNVGAPQSIDQYNTSTTPSSLFTNCDNYPDTDAVLIE